MRATPFLVILVIAATHASDVDVEVTFAAKPTSWKRTILRSFGSGHASLTLREDWRNDLRQVKADLNPEFVRFHGILDDDMSTYLNDAPNMYNVFSTIDFLQSLDMRPIVELSFMPAKLAKNTSITHMHYNAIQSPPKSYEDWGSFIEEFVLTLMSRYTIEEVSQWYFEVWNEPNCGFWGGDFAEYWQLYNATARAVHRASDKLRVGGPVSCKLGLIPDFLGNASVYNAPVDVVTSHLYPTDPILDNTNRNAFPDAIAFAAKQSGSHPFLLTEFNGGLGLEVGQNAPYTSAFVVFAAIHTQPIENLALMSFWTFSEVFEEQGMQSSPYWRYYYSIQTLQGVKKPVYRALQLINGLLPSVIGTQNTGTVDVVVTTVADAPAATGQVYALATNYVFHGQPITNETVTITVEDFGCTVPTTAQLIRVDDTHGNSLPTWVSQGKPVYPSSSQVAAMKAASQVVAETVPVKVSGSSATVTFTLPPYGVAALQMQCA